MGKATELLSRIYCKKCRTYVDVCQCGTFDGLLCYFSKGEEVPQFLSVEEMEAFIRSGKSRDELRKMVYGK